MRRALFWAAGGAGAAGLVLLALWSPPDEPALTLCFTRRALGLPCPGCGLTRGLAQLLQGNLARAVALHPLAPLVALDAAAGWGLWGLTLYGLTPAPPAATVRRLLLAQLAVFVALWLGRLATGTAPL